MTNPFDDRLDDARNDRAPTTRLQRPETAHASSSHLSHLPPNPALNKHTPTIRTIRTHPNEETIPRNLANMTDEEWLRSRRQFLNLDFQYRIGRDEDGEKCL